MDEKTIQDQFDIEFSEQLKKYFANNKGLSNVRILNGRAWMTTHEYPVVQLENNNTCTFITSSKERRNLSIAKAVRLFAGEIQYIVYGNRSSLSDNWDDDTTREEKKNINKYRSICASIEVINRIMICGFIMLVITILLGMLGLTFLVVPLVILYFLLMIIGGLWKLLLNKKEKLGKKLSEHGINYLAIEQQIEEKFKKKNKEKDKKSNKTSTSANSVTNTNTISSTVVNTSAVKAVSNNSTASNTSTVASKKNISGENKSAEDSASVFIGTSNSATTAEDKNNTKPENKTSSEAIKVENIEQSADIANSNGVEKNMHPGGISKRSEEAEKYVDLFWLYDYKYSGWGISEKVCIDPESGQVYYIATQYDGQIAAQTWYLEKSQISYEEMYELAKTYAKDDANKFKDITDSNWKKLIGNKK